MKRKTVLSRILMSVALLLLIASFFMPQMKGDTALAAYRVESVVKARLQKLDKLADQALASNPEQWMDLSKVPDDMVVYRYVSDRLQSWANQFPVSSDDIITTQSYHRLSNPRARVKSPLTTVSEEYTLFKLGSKYFLIKQVSEGNVKVIVGLNVGDNKRYRIDPGYKVAPLSSGEGSPVVIDGEPRFNVIFDAMPVKSALRANTVWLAFLFFCCGLLLVISCAPSLKRCLTAVGLMLAAMLWAIYRHPVLQGEITLILPVLVLNLMVFFIAMAMYLAREDIWSRLKPGRMTAIFRTLLIIVIAALLVLAYFNILEVITYTHISMQLYKIGQLSIETGWVYLSFLLMFTGLVLLVQMLRFFNVFTIAGRAVSAVLMAAYIVIVTSVLGFQKEEMIISQWAETLANDRDINLENQLRRVERQIAYDDALARTSESEEYAPMAFQQLSEKYFFRTLKSYNLNVQIGGNAEDLGLAAGVQIAPGSRFYYSPQSGQRCRYVGVFHFFTPDKGQNTMYITLEPRDMGNRDAFKAVFSPEESRDVIPSMFSYAKYKGNERQYYKGTYAYPTKLTSELESRFASGTVCHFTENGYIHYVNTVGDQEYIVISRINHGDLRYVLAVILVAIVLFFIFGLFPLALKRGQAREKHYFKTAVSVVLMLSLSITMATLAVVSVTFVYTRNEIHAQRMMSDKANSIRNMLQSGLRNVASADELTSRETMVILRRVSDNTMSDISLFRPDGRVFMSTTPEIFDRMLVGCRMNGNAYEEIMYRNRGFSIYRERYGNKRIYTMYAPIMDADGEVLCLFASPYVDTTYDFEWDAIMHTVSIVVMFLVLLLMSSLLVSLLVDRIFKPLYEMKANMDAGDLNGLEHLVYHHDDEIKPLVESYNRMVDDLVASSRSLAQAERDKAWSEMARNVAHEIKNPLTPMQLQIQRVQRLKALGDPNWQLRFDEMAKVLLDHIEVLTDTANQFSDFARLYAEDPVEIRLDELLREEVDMYDSRPGVEFEYLGLPDTVINGPRPQLVRVFVNLLNNAVQACEGREDARIVVSLRNGAQPDYYEIVFEDNGPGVDESNVEKLFTPRFTTKSSGSGLGLSICRSILERCGASISYSRSFRLGGACFTIQYPKL